MTSLAPIGRRALYGFAQSRRLETLVRATPPLERRAYKAAERYLGGRTREAALVSLASLHRQGFATGIDYFGEAQTDPAAVDAATTEYLQLNGDLAGLDEPANVWLDLSNVGLDISAELCRRDLHRIVETLPAGSRLQVRAHDCSRTDRILELVTELHAEGAPVMATLQANLRRSSADAARLVETGVPTLIVKGAHPEPAAVAYPWGEQTDVALLELAHQLHAGGVELSIGTHDPVVRESLLAALDGVGVEMLLGIRTEDGHDLLRRGHRVRMYVPYGGEWLRYWLRRAGTAIASR